MVEARLQSDEEWTEDNVVESVLVNSSQLTLKETKVGLFHCVWECQWLFFFMLPLLSLTIWDCLLQITPNISYHVTLNEGKIILTLFFVGVSKVCQIMFLFFVSFSALSFWMMWLSEKFKSPQLFSKSQQSYCLGPGLPFWLTGISVSYLPVNG